MAGTQDGNGISASPNSSEEIDSHRGTPATKVSAFSPEENLESLKIATHGIIRSNVPPPFNLVHTNTNFSANGKVGEPTSLLFQDPFVSVSLSNNLTQPSTGVSKLSPGASDFTPATSTAFSSSNGRSVHIPSLHIDVSSPGYPASPAASSSSQNNSVATKCAVSGPPGSGLRSTSIRAATTHHETSSTAEGDIGRGFSSDEGLSRAIMLCKIPPTTSIDDIYGLLGVSLAHDNYESTYSLMLGEQLLFPRAYPDCRATLHRHDLSQVRGSRRGRSCVLCSQSTLSALEHQVHLARAIRFEASARESKGFLYHNFRRPNTCGS